MALTPRNIPDTVQAAIDVAQAECPQLTDFTPGSPMLAIMNASAFMNSYMQFLAFEVLKTTRLTTSVTDDVDSFVGQFGLDRLPASRATGLVTFSRFTPYANALIQPGAQVKTADGSVIFEVVENEAHEDWDDAQGGYLLASGVLDITVPVQARVAGSGSNVQSGTIALLASSIPGVDSVTNSAGFVNGVDGESDESLRGRFPAYINTRSQATNEAVAYAINSTQQGLSFSILENTDSAGNDRRGFFTICLDDGTGNPSEALMGEVKDAVDLVRPLAVQFALIRPQVITANVSLTINALPGYDKTKLIYPVANALRDYINALGVGQKLSFYKLADIAHNIEGVKSINGLRVNNGEQDLGGAKTQSVYSGNVVVN